MPVFIRRKQTLRGLHHPSVARKRFQPFAEVSLCYVSANGPQERTPGSSQLLPPAPGDPRSLLQDLYPGEKAKQKRRAIWMSFSEEKTPGKREPLGCFRGSHSYGRCDGSHPEPGTAPVPAGSAFPAERRSLCRFPPAEDGLRKYRAVLSPLAHGNLTEQKLWEQRETAQRSSTAFNAACYRDGRFLANPNTALARKSCLGADPCRG